MRKKETSTKAVKLITLVLCILVTCGLAAGGAYYYTEYSKAQQKLLPQRQRVKELKQDISDLDVFLHRYATDISRLEKILFEDKDIPLFLEGISRASSRFSTNITEIKALSPQIVDMEGSRIRRNRRRSSARQREPEKQDSLTLGSSPFRIKMKGVFGDVIQALLSLQEHRQLLSVSNVVIKEKEYPLLECSFDLDLYSLIKKGEKGGRP